MGRRLRRSKPHAIVLLPEIVDAVGSSGAGGMCARNMMQRRYLCSIALLVITPISLLTSCSSSKSKQTAASETTNPSRRPQPSPPVKLPPPTAEDVRHVVARVFAGTVVVEGGVAAKFTVGDFNGDGSEDVAVLVRPNAAKLREINSTEAHWIIWDPLSVPMPDAHHRLLHLSSKVRVPHVRRSDVLLAIIHGWGPEGWRNPEAYQSFLLQNLAHRTPAAERLPALLLFQPRPEDVLVETAKGRVGYLYWLGTACAWHPGRDATSTRLRTPNSQRRSS